MQMWTNLVRPKEISAISPSLSYRHTLIQTNIQSHCPLTREDNEFSVLQLQPTRVQRNTDDNGNIIALPCPTEVRNCAEDSHACSYQVSMLTCIITCTVLYSTFLLSQPASFSIIASALPKDRPFLRTEGNSPSYHHRDASPLLHPVSTVKWRVSQCCTLPV